MPTSICIVGCGLIGMSLAMAVRSQHPDAHLIGVDIRPEHRSIAADKQTFDELLCELRDLNSSVDLVILAVPPNAAVRLLEEAAACAAYVMDVCSIKSPLCEQAQAASFAHQYIPSHPMAGLASIGPSDATESLFANQPWILLHGWGGAPLVEPFLTSLNARVVWMESAAAHDQAMSIVSHSIHLTSLSAMLSFQRAQRDSDVSYAPLTGPGFRDITRLADSPSEFWLDTLLANADPVSHQLENIIQTLQAFQTSLLSRDARTLMSMLDDARVARQRWRIDHNVEKP